MKVGKSKLFKIVLSVCIVLVVAGIWIYKNYGNIAGKQAVPSENGGEVIEPSTEEDDFALNADSLDLEKLSSYGLPIIIDFGAGWCGPCREFAPILEAMHEEMLGKAIIKYVDTDEHSEIASEFPIQVIPTQVFINSDGTPYVPSENIDVEFSSYTYKDSNELAFTVHLGGLTAEQLRAILIDMGVSE